MGDVDREDKFVTVRRALTAAACVLTLVLGGAIPAAAAPSELFFSEYIEGSSNNKALEIYNGTGAPIDLAANAYSVQMFFNGATAAGLTINLTGTVASGDVFVLAHSSASPTILAQADQTNGAGWFNGDDAVLLRKGTTTVDSIGQVGFDPGTEWGTALTSTADNTLRRKAAIEAGDTNSADAFDPAVEWDGYATDTFDGLGAHGTAPPGDTAPAVTATTPANNASDVPVNSNVTITFSEPVNVTGAWYTISCADTGAHTATASGGPTTFTLDPDADFGLGETCTVTLVASQVTDQDANDPPDAMTANHVFSFSTVGAFARIHEIQGAAHLSSFDGDAVSGVPGVVTARGSNGFYMQDAEPDADPATSEGIFVFTGSAPAAALTVGTAVTVSGRVSEFRGGCTPSCDPGSSGFDNLTLTEIVNPTVTPGGPGAAIPVTIIGNGGRVPPATVIDNDSPGNVETGTTFDPAQDGIDFYESLEGMFVGLNDAVATGPTNGFGEIPVVGDNGVHAGPRTLRGGVVVAPDDFNPERVILDDVLTPAEPKVDVADRFAVVRGVMDYGFGNFKLQVTQPLVEIDGGLQREATVPQAKDELAVGSFNVENLDPSDPAEKFAELAALIVNNLRSPDIVGVQEVQDNDGATNTTVADASVTFGLLIAAIQAAGGPEYKFTQIDPVDDQDGGEPGGNIRVGFLYNPDRVEFESRPGGTPTTANAVERRNRSARLVYNPGRIDPTNPAFDNSRKPLAAEFRFRGERVFAIVNHFNSKGGDDPLFGRFQPPVRSSEVQRHRQAAIVNGFVDEIVAANPNAFVVVLGDMNDFDFSQTLDILEGGGELVNLMDLLPKSDRYSYVFDGNSQVLDQMLATPRLVARGRPAYDVVHVNAEFNDQASDHDPQVARFVLR